MIDEDPFLNYKLEVPPNYMVVFSGDCVHFGSAYPDSDNVRIYFKCAPESTKFVDDLAQTNREVIELVTEGKDAEIMKCKGCKDGCMFKAERSKIYAHQYFCEYIHTSEVVEQRRSKKKRRDDGYYKNKKVENNINK